MIAWFDCFSGISGDMILGAFVDAGWPMEELRRTAQRLNLKGVKVSAHSVSRNGIEGISIRITEHGNHTFRTLPVIEDIIAASSLSEEVGNKSMEIFRILADAEAKVHGCKPEEVHFHEVGAVDTIIDITGAVKAVHDLGIEQCFCSPLPMGRGFVKCSHGTIPLPAPAVSRIVSGMPVYGVDIPAELVTPTGAALMKGLCSTFGPMPAMALEKTGYGAGCAELSELPNMLRIWMGERERASLSRITRLSTCIDDMNPEWFPYVMKRLMDAGALDAFIRPVYMKKGRPGHELVVLSPPGSEDTLQSIIFSETTTSGIRFISEARYLLPRRIASVETPWGQLKVKIIKRPDGKEDTVPEYEECRRIAKEHGIPLARVYRQILKLDLP